jgi:uncharacterized protein YciI
MAADEPPTRNGKTHHVLKAKQPVTALCKESGGTDMSYFAYKLIPPRPTFAHDMTEAEANLMREHVAYWTDLATRRVAVVFGPVSDPRGPWGLAVVQAADEAEARALGTNDPTIKGGAGFQFEVYPMPLVVLRERA